MGDLLIAHRIESAKPGASVERQRPMARSLLSRYEHRRRPGPSHAGPLARVPLKGVSLPPKRCVIVVGVDFSDLGDRAFEQAYELAAASANSEIHALFVIPTTSINPLTG